MKLRLHVIGIVALLATPIFVGQAGAAPASMCGTVITQDTVLQGDVGPCRNNGIIVGADNITLDLNGHRLFGTDRAGDGAGVLVSKHTGVTVRNGTVARFDGGIVIEGGSANTVTGITAKDNIGSAGNVNSGSGATDFGEGIAVMSSTNNLINDNTVDHNGPYAGIGLYEIIDADHPREVSGPTTKNQVKRNVVSNNNVCRFEGGFCDNDGIRLEPGVHNNVVTNNVVTGSALDGIALFRGSADNVVEENDVRANGFHSAGHRKGDGIRVFPGADRTLVQLNQSFGNAANGIIINSKSNQILDNQTGGNAVVPPARPQLQAYDLRDTNVNCDANVWSGNTYGTALPACTTGP